MTTTTLATGLLHILVLLAAGMGFGLGLAVGIGLMAVAASRARLREAMGTPYTPTPSRMIAAPPDAEERMKAYALEAAIERGTQDLMDRAKQAGRPLTQAEAREHAARLLGSLDGDYGAYP